MKVQSLIDSHTMEIYFTRNRNSINKDERTISNRLTANGKDTLPEGGKQARPGIQENRRKIITKNYN